MAVSPVMKDAEPLLLNVGEDQYNLEEFPEESVALGDSDYLEDQIEWSESFKWGVVGLLSFMGFTVSVYLRIAGFQAGANYTKLFHLHLNSPSGKLYSR
jgi:hypothetical protein